MDLITMLKDHQQIDKQGEPTRAMPKPTGVISGSELGDREGRWHYLMQVVVLCGGSVLPGWGCTHTAGTGEDTNMVHPSNGILSNNKKKWSPVTHYNMDESWKTITLSERSQMEKNCTVYDSICYGKTRKRTFTETENRLGDGNVN